MHHLGMGVEHRGKRCIPIADETTVTVIHLDTGGIIATNTIDPPALTGETTKRSPADGQAPLVDVTYDASQMSPMSRLITLCPRQESNLRPLVPETNALSPELRRRTDRGYHREMDSIAAARRSPR